MKKLFLSIALISITSCVHGELLNDEMQPAVDGISAYTWAPKASIIPLLDKFYVEVSLNDHTYKSDADFLFAMNDDHQWSSEQEKAEAKLVCRYLSIYLRFAVDLLSERQDLIQRSKAFVLENNNSMPTQQEWEFLFNTIGAPATMCVTILPYFMNDVLFEQEVETHVQKSLENFL